jgi:hypothetical protein
MNLNSGEESAALPCAYGEVWNSCDTSSSAADRVLTARGGQYIRIPVPWDTFGADGGGCSWGYDGDQHARVLNDALAVVKTYRAIPVLVFSGSDRAAPPTGPNAGADMVCAITKAKAALQYVGAWSPSTVLEPWNEPDRTMPNDSYDASLYFAADYGFNPGYAVILPGVFTSGFAGAYANSYLGSLEYHWKLYPVVWSIHDYHDPYSSDQVGQNETCSLAAFRTWLSNKGLGSDNRYTWITEAGNPYGTSVLSPLCSGVTQAHSGHTRVGDAWAASGALNLNNWAAHVFWYHWYTGNSAWDSALDAYDQPTESSHNYDGYYGGPGMRTSWCVLVGDSVADAVADTTGCGGAGEPHG